MILENSLCSSISAGPMDTGLSTKTTPATELLPNCCTYAATSCAPCDHPTSTGRATPRVARRSCKSRALDSGEFPSVVFVDSPCDGGSTAITRVTLEKVFNCSVHRYAGNRQPGSAPMPCPIRGGRPGLEVVD